MSSTGRTRLGTLRRMRYGILMVWPIRPLSLCAYCICVRCIPVCMYTMFHYIPPQYAVCSEEVSRCMIIKTVTKLFSWYRVVVKEMVPWWLLALKYQIHLVLRLNGKSHSSASGGWLRGYRKTVQQVWLLVWVLYRHSIDCPALWTFFSPHPNLQQTNSPVSLSENKNTSFLPSFIDSTER